MELASDVLTKSEWVESDAPQRRLRFRPDGTGFYEREGEGERRFVHENLLWRVEGGRLHLKFAHARFWTEVDATLREGGAGPDARIGQRLLVLTRDPYAWTLEERPTDALALLSDRGAALPSA